MAKKVDRTDEQAQQKRKLLKLIKQGVPIRAAAQAAGVPPSTAYRWTGGGTRATPFGPNGIGQAPPNTPDPSWSADQPPPPPDFLKGDAKFRTGYHDHTYRSFIAPIGFDGFSLRRIRNAVATHRAGFFLESYLLSVVALSFAPVYAAITQRMAPALSLPRQVKAGTRGLSRLLGEEIEAQIAPRDGLVSSPYFPLHLWGSAILEKAFMGFSVFQHVDGAPDPDTGVRPRFTRRWPVWAVQYYSYRRTFVAITSEGPVDILNDGKFTLIADSEEPHLLGAILPLAEEALDGKQTQRARASYIDRYGNPKWVGTMPEGVAVKSPEGNALFDAVSTIRGPDGFGLLPNGTELKLEGLTSSQSSTFKDALDSNKQFVAMTLLGTDGTISSGTGGVYQSPSFKGIRRDIVDSDLSSLVRGVNQGHVAPYLGFNYAASIAEQGPSFVTPVVDIPLPDPDADARIASYATRVKSFHEIVQSEREAGFIVTVERVEQLSKEMSIQPPTLATGLQLEPKDASCVVFVDEARAAQGLPPHPDAEKGKMTIAELQKKGKDAGAEGEESAPAAPAGQ